MEVLWTNWLVCSNFLSDNNELTKAEQEIAKMANQANITQTIQEMEQAANILMVSHPNLNFALSDNFPLSEPIQRLSRFAENLRKRLS